MKKNLENSKTLSNSITELQNNNIIRKRERVYLKKNFIIFAAKLITKSFGQKYYPHLYYKQKLDECGEILGEFSMGSLIGKK